MKKIISKIIATFGTARGSFSRPRAGRHPFVLIAFAFAGFAFLPAQAVSPPPDGGYPGGNTAEGQNALLSLNVNTGTNNTAVGWFSLKSNVEGQFNTAVGAGTLFSNTADRNTAIGGAAMFSNTSGTSNTALGTLSLFNNITGNSNTAIGDRALFFNTAGLDNTAIGNGALSENGTGDRNTALGQNAGANVFTANNVICIGADVFGENVGNACYIGNIFGSSSPFGTSVFVNEMANWGRALLPGVSRKTLSRWTRPAKCS
jgi:hypothetical protein